MKNIKTLLDRGEVNEAVDALYDALRYLINTFPNVDLTKKEFDELMPLLLEKMENPDEPVESKPTPAPGDDVTISPARGTVDVILIGPDGVQLQGFTTSLAKGQDFKFEVPEIPGYVADIKVVSGKMGGGDSQIVVKYIKKPEVEIAPIYGTLRVKSDNEGKPKGYMSGTMVPGENIHAFVAGKYIKDQFDKEAEVKPAKDMPTGVWWPGIILHAPEAMTNREEFNTVPARYQINGTGEWVNFTLGETIDSSKKEMTAYGKFDTPQPDLSGKEGEERKQAIEQWQKQKEEALKGDGKECQSYLWVPIDPDKLAAPNGEDGFYHYLLQIDWNKDGLYEQNVDIGVQPQNTYLYETADDLTDNKYIWPKKKSV